MKILRAILAASALVIASLCAHAQFREAPLDSVNFQGLWWGGVAEAGWNLNLSHQGDVIFATWATYDAMGNPTWLSMTAWKNGLASYAGSLYITRGPSYARLPFDASLVRSEEVGHATIAFITAREGRFSYEVFGIEGAKAITRFEPVASQPVCRWNAVEDLAWSWNLQDLWYADPAGSELGWGVGIAHIGNTFFATWLTYDANGAPTWFFGSASWELGDYGGPLYRSTGPSMLDKTWNPAAVSSSQIGFIGFENPDGNHMTMSTAVAGLRQERKLTRFVFRGSGTACIDGVD